MVSNERSYRSSLREERALETRLRIRRSARELFERQGFAATTIAEIAQTAGVATPTVYATFGSKGRLVIEMMEELEELAGAEGAAPMLFAETDPRRQLGLFIGFIRALFERGAPILRAAMDARGDPDVKAMAAVGNGRRLEGTTMLAVGWEAQGALREGVTVDEAAGMLWLLTSAEQFMLAVDDLGWTPDVYEERLVGVLAASLLRG